MRAGRDTRALPAKDQWSGPSSLLIEQVAESKRVHRASEGMALRCFGNIISQPPDLSRMAIAPAAKSVLRFGVFELDRTTGELRKNGLLLKLHPQPAKMLVLLASHPEELVTRERFKEALWGQDTFVDFEQGLNSCVRHIRNVLADDPDNPRFIETIPRKGYRFIAPVIWAGMSAGISEPPAPAPRTTASPPRRRTMALLAALALIVITGLGVLYFGFRRQPVCRQNHVGCTSL